MCQHTWSEIEAMRAAAHKRHHSQPISSLSTESQKDFARLRFKGQALDAVYGDDLFRFRITGEQRLWGFRSNRMFHVIWWDPNHQVYPTEKN